jgi:hypothetical protein
MEVAQLTLSADFDAVLYGRAGCGVEAPEVLCRAAGRQASIRIERPSNDIVLFVDGAGPADGGAFTLSLKAPQGGEGDACGSPNRPMPLQVGGSTAGARRDLDPGAGCAGAFPLPGPDVAYSVFLADGDTLHARLTPTGWDGALYVLGGCEEVPVCLAGVDAALSGGTETLVWTAEADGAVLLVVDSFGAGGDFRLDASVADPDR